jgi:hypothetical protein
MRTLSLASIAAALVLSMGLVLAAPALAQTAGADRAAQTKKKKSGKKGSATAAEKAPADATSAPADKASAKGKKGSKKKGKKGEQAAKPIDDLAPPPSAPVPVAPAPTATTVIIKTPAAPVAPAPEPELVPGQYDDDPPLIAHAQIKQAMHNKPLVFTAHITDPSGVFQPVLYLRKRGTGDYLPIKLIASKAVQGDYAVEVDAKLISVDLEYYIECYDNAGNGPARVGNPENPFEIALEEEKKPVIVPGQIEKHPGAPPAISHQTISKATKGQNIEIPAKLVGDTGVSQAQVFFRHAGEHDFHGFPMGSVGGDDYSATIPASAVSGDLEYYLEAYDKYGNGPGRSGGPMVPYQISVSEAPPPPLIVTTPLAEKRPELPRLVKVPFSPNPGRAAGWLFMAGFIATTAYAGGELYGAYNADQAYQHEYSYDGRLDSGVHQSSLDYARRARVFGLVAGGSLVVSIALLLIFPEHPDTQIVAPNGDIAVAHF